MGKLKKILDFRKFEKGKRTQFILNIAAGLAIVLIMHGLENTRWGEGLLNSAFDRFIKSEAKEAVEINEDPGDLLLLDIRHHKKNEEKEEDEKTNFLSPRDTIAGLLEMAFAGDASVIVLDFSFEENDCCHPERDQQLRKILEENNNKKTKVIFPVRVGPDNKLKKLIFDELVDKNPNYIRAISTLLASPNDAVVRYWKAFQEYEDYKILWSIPVLAVALHIGKEKELEKLESLVIQRDKKIDVYPLEIKTGKDKKKLLLPLDEDDFYLQRIRFRLIPKDCIDGSPEGNIRVYNIEHMNLQRFKNKIVIIGNSDPEVGDVLSTPVVAMAGMYIREIKIGETLDFRSTIRVLGKKDEKIVDKALAKIDREKLSAEEKIIKKAAYLQFISDLYPGQVDLYWFSFQLLNKAEIKDERLLDLYEILLGSCLDHKTGGITAVDFTLLDNRPGCLVTVDLTMDYKTNFVPPDFPFKDYDTFSLYFQVNFAGYCVVLHDSGAQPGLAFPAESTDYQIKPGTGYRSCSYRFDDKPALETYLFILSDKPLEEMEQYGKLPGNRQRKLLAVLSRRAKEQGQKIDLEIIGSKSFAKVPGKSFKGIIWFRVSLEN